MKKISKNSIVTVLAVSFVLCLTGPIAALAATTPSLGAAATYGVLASTYTDTSAATTVNGDVGFTTPPATAIAGVHVNYGSGAPYATAGTDQGSALSALASQLCTFTFAPGAINLSTDTTHGTAGLYAPGVYCSSGAMSVGGPLTLSGSGTYIFRPVGALTSVVGSVVTLIGGASACDVFWTPTAATTLAATTTFAGTVIDNAGITVGATTTWTGRALAFGGTVTTATDTITVPTCAAPTGSIAVVKNAVGGNGTFAFTSNFGLTSLTTVGGTASQTVSGLTAGSSYSLSETVPAGWTQTGGSCTAGTLPAAITVVAGATTTCTITNTVVAPPPPGSITVVKNTVGGDGAFAFTSTFGLTSPLTTIGGTVSQTVSSLAPGSYSVTETVPAGWTQTSASCRNGTPAAIIVVSGVTTTCTITNIRQGSITVVKNTVGGDGTFAFSSNFGLISPLTTIGGTVSQTVSSLTPGSYSVTETVPAGWLQTSASCTTPGSASSTLAAITVVAGLTTTCTITNTKQGSITVVKTTVGGDGTFAFTSNFGLTSLTTLGGTASLTFPGLTPGGSFSVIETVPAGWAQTSGSCTNGTPAAITVAAGVTTTCTITNTKQPLPPPPPPPPPPPTPTGSISVVKNTVGGDGTFAFSSNFGLTSLTTSGGTASQTFSNLTAGGSFSLSETLPDGWTQTSASCTNGTPAAIIVVSGATTTCTITNTKGVALLPDLTIRKSHSGNFRQGDTGNTYTLTVTNAGPGPTTGAVTVSDMLPAGLTATAISGPGWSCTLTPLTCTRSDALASGASYPVITVTVNVANNGLAFNQVAGSPAFQTGDILISLADGTVQWQRHDFTLVKILKDGSDGQAKGLAFDSSGNLYVTHWTGSASPGNDVTRFDRNGNFIGLFGSGFDCNPSSILFDNSGNAYVSHVDCSMQIFKLDSAGNRLAQYTVAVENRGSYNIVLDPNQCTMYYTSSGPNVKRFNVCSNTQMSNFNTASLPDPVGGGQQFALLPGGGMLVADFSVIARLDALGKLVATYNTSAGNQCWLGMALDPDGTSFWAGDWCGSSATRFDIATGNVIESHVADPRGFMVKQLAIPGNIFSSAVTNTATVAGGGELNTTNDSASDATPINPPAQPAPASNPGGIVNAASYLPTVAAGSIATVFGSNLSIGTASSAGAIPYPTTLAGSSIQIGGRAAPLSFASPSQVNLQIPWELAGQTQASVIATVGAVLSNQQTMSIAPFAPGIFTLNEAGSSQGAVLIAGTPLFAAPPSAAGRQPAKGGELISIYCTGLGAVSNQPATGFAAAPADPLSVTTTTPTVTIGGMVAQVSFSGLAPGTVGLYQVNVQVPLGAPAGNAVQVTLSNGGATSNTVTIVVQ